MVPGSHRGPIFDHHVDGHFCGAIDPATPGLNLKHRQPCVGTAGSITIHHARTLHGSAMNRSGRERRFLVLQMRSADAWPLVNRPDWDGWTSLLVAGQETHLPRMEAVPVRLPFPGSMRPGTLYENQLAQKNRFFDDR